MATGMVALYAAACGGSKKDAESAAEADDGKDHVPWAKQRRDQRLDWMGVEVFPKMRLMFREHDADYADFSCQSCHGANMEMVNYAMPNPSLYSLPKADPVKDASEYNAEVATFMAEKVVPAMADMLDMPVSIAEPERGFGCFGCHPTSGE